jgi:hypothetical protein
LNQGVPLEVDLPSGYKRSTALTNRYAKLAGANIPTKVDILTRKVDMMRSNHIMNESDQTT